MGDIEDRRDLARPSHEDLFREQPGLGTWLASLSRDAKGGALGIYGMVRRQAAAQQLRDMFGDK